MQFSLLCQLGNYFRLFPITNSHLNYFIFFLKLIHSSLSVFSSSLGEFGSNFTSELLDIVSLSLGFVSRHEDWRRSSGITWRGKLYLYLPKIQYKIVFKFTLLQFIFGNFILFRHKCFTGKFTTLKILGKLYPGLEWRIFHVLPGKEIDDVISCVFIVVYPNNQSK